MNNYIFIVAIFFFGLLFLSKSDDRTENKEMNFESKMTNCKQATRVLTDGSGPSLVCDSL